MAEDKEQDQGEVKNLVNFNGSPYYVKETDNGIFYAVKCVYEKTNDKYNFFYEFFEKRFTLGMDIKEFSSRSLELYIEVPEGIFSVPVFIERCRAFASVAGYDQFSLENFGDAPAQFIEKSGNINMFKIRPRLFRNIVDN
jgi:hypothetical protein